MSTNRLDEAVEIYFEKIIENEEDYPHLPYDYGYPLKMGFKDGAKWAIESHSCCCSGCTKHNLALVNEESNGEFKD